ncbi:MAG: IS4 family transposase [Bacillota bacterium]
MNEYANSLKQTLTSLIREMSAAPAPYVKNPKKDFTRKKKLPFETVMQLLISMGGNSIYKELLESQGYDVNTATTSAFVQQRNKILPSAVEFLFHEFTQSYTDIKYYRGYRLLAVDGSDLHIATDSVDTDTYFQSQPNTKGYNLLHLNAAYDLCNRLYVDAIVQPRRLCNEGRALADMVDRSPIKGKTIVTADRGYESYNNFAHLERKGWNYVIRVKDLDSNGILSGLRLPSSGEFGRDVHLTLTKKQTKEVKANPEIYKFVPSTSTFDFLDLHENLFYPISFRVVRFVLPSGTYETVITNLSAADFPPDEIKSIYNMRWGIETSFRALKYTVGLTNFHAKRQESIAQEIFARMIMYNFAEMITSHVVISQMDKRHQYQVNFTVAVHVCRHFLRSWDDEPPPDVEALIRKNILPIRPIRQGQKNTRKIRCKSAVSFVYRVA